MITTAQGLEGDAPKSEARREAAQTEGRAHERSEVAARRRDKALNLVASERSDDKSGHEIKAFLTRLAPKSI